MLEAAGFRTREEAFGYSQFPGRYGTPVVGGLGAASLAGAAWLGDRGDAGGALLLLAVTAAVLGALGRWLGTSGVLDFPAARARGVNLIAVRDGDAPRIWLMAHSDSKSQPVPSGVRAGGVIVLILAALALAGFATAEVLGGQHVAQGLWRGAGALAVLGGIPVALSVVGNASAGALDNASGLAAVLAAAESLEPGLPVGVVVTAAEELGLAGARAWVRDVGAGHLVVLNCDGVDDVGSLTAMFTGRRAGRVLAALAAAAREQGVGFRAMRLIPGILVDAVAVAAAGGEAATLSRGTLATLGRVHTRRDDLAHLAGRGIPEAAATLARAARRLVGEEGVGRGEAGAA